VLVQNTRAFALVIALCMINILNGVVFIGKLLGISHAREQWRSEWLGTARTSFIPIYNYALSVRGEL